MIPFGLPFVLWVCALTFVSGFGCFGLGSLLRCAWCLQI